MHTPDLDGYKHRASRAAQRLDLFIFTLVLILGTLAYFSAPLVAEWMEKQ